MLHDGVDAGISLTNESGESITGSPLFPLHYAMANRAAKILLGLAVVAVVFAALPWKPFELDRYFVPKELVLNAATLIIAAMLFIRRRTISYDLADALLALFLLWSAASAVFSNSCCS